MNKKVDFYFEKAKSWKEEFNALRTIALACGLNEELKWGHPCYTLNGSNVVLMHGFKEYCALLFFKGVLLKDPENILVQQTVNVQSARQIRFTTLKEIVKRKALIKKYISEAIDIENKGLKVGLKKTSEFSLPVELEEQLKKDSRLKKAFYALTPGRQRAYLLFFSKAKQSQTRLSRIEKCKSRIYEGKGLND